MRNPVKILGTHFSYDEKSNSELIFNANLRKIKTKLDMWNARDLTLFGRVVIVKALGLSRIIYSASNLDVPVGTVGTLKKKLFNFIWRNKEDKIKRTGLYQDLEKGGTGMVDVDLMFKALTRACWFSTELPKPKKFCPWTTLKACGVF